MKKTLIALVFLTILCSIAISLINPQVNKWVYVWQGNVCPNSEFGWIDYSDDYNGIWKDWYYTGQLAAIANLVNGDVDGVAISYFEDGTIKDIKRFSGGKAMSIFFFPSGDTSMITIENNISSTNTLIFDRLKNIDLRHKYRKQIREFEKELRAFEKEHGLPPSPPIEIPEPTKVAE